MSEQMSETRMLAALNATNEAILRTHSQDKLFKGVCDAAVRGGGFRAAAALVPESDGQMRFVAFSSPEGEQPFEGVKISIDPISPYGNGVAGRAFRGGRPQLCHDILNDERLGPWHATSGALGMGAVAAIPILRDRSSIGVFLFFLAEAGSLNGETVDLMERMVENVCFGLKSFERDLQNARTSRMLAALSATNEAVIRANSRDELFQMVCDAAVNGAKFTSTTIFLSRPDSDFFHRAATAGPLTDKIRTRRYAKTAEYPEGRGLTGTAFRTGQPCIKNDFEAHEKAIQWVYDNSENRTAKAGACLPLFGKNEVAGVILFMASEKDTFTPDLVELLQRMAENVSFGLGNFDRADEKKEADARIQYLATHDGLTGLPNRSMFTELFDQSIKSARRKGVKCAVLFIDLDRFKVINDSLGHSAGDTLLVEAATRVRDCVRESDLVARIGGDEFVVVLDEVSDRDQITEVARKVLISLMPTLTLGGHECRTTASIGIAVFPDDGADAQTLTKNADIAMYLAKEEGKNGFRFYTPQIQHQSIERLTLETELRHALERGQFSLHYQPKIDVLTEEINGVEALLRWAHPQLGNLPPMKFIPVAEETGLIIPIGRWVLRTACAQNMAWQREGMPAISMAVNLSPRQFLDETLLHDIDGILASTGMPAHLLQLEITESMVMQNVERAIELLDAIQSRGVRLAIDDFGTGYSSMSLLKQFPIDTIKIDRSFVRDLAENVEDRAIAHAIINMGRALGLTVVAEGVETTEQDIFLRQHECNELQGYLFSKPVPASEIPLLLQQFVCSPPLQPQVHPALNSNRDVTTTAPAVGGNSRRGYRTVAKERQSSAPGSEL